MSVPGSVDVAVVGAGLAGLCAAIRLQQAGLQVAVLESADHVGGRIATDVVNGFLLDRGFQVYNTGYPEAASLLDHRALDLRAFTPGVLVRLGDRLHRLTDPRRRPLDAPRALLSPVLSAPDKLRLAALSARDAVLSAERLQRVPETSTYEALRRRGLSEQAIDRVLRPFLAGVFLEQELATSSRFFDLVWRTFARGTVCVPAGGMREIPRQLAKRLGPDVVRLGTSARSVRAGAVETEAGTVRAAAVVVATDPDAAARLLADLPPVAMNGVTTYYHATTDPPLHEPTLVLDGEGGPVASAVVLTAAAPTYSPDARALVSSSVVGTRPADERAVRRALERLFGVETTSWEHVGTTAVPRALPRAVPPLDDLRRPVDLGGGLFVAGDHRDTPSIQGAMVSGRRAAVAVLQRLHGRNGR